MLVAAHAALLPPGALPLRIEDLAAQCFNGHELVGAEIGDGAGRAYTDFRIHADGFSRYLLADFYMGRRQAGRMLQRLLELETYRMLALLALPVAKSIAPELAKVDEELAELTGAMGDAGADSEPQLLHRLTELAGATENALSRTDHRFNASLAYYDIARCRIAELRERRIQGLQPFQQFLQRRLTPAIDTCRAVAARQRALAERVNRATALLRTRVDIRRERQNQALLTSMERRAAMQLHLQQTVEGLSIAAITYYSAGLIGYLLKGAKAAGLALNVELATAAAVPLLALAIALGLRARAPPCAAMARPPAWNTADTCHFSYPSTCPILAIQVANSGQRTWRSRTGQFIMPPQNGMVDKPLLIYARPSRRRSRQRRTPCMTRSVWTCLQWRSAPASPPRYASWTAIKRPFLWSKSIVSTMPCNLA